MFYSTPVQDTLLRIYECSPRCNVPANIIDAFRAFNSSWLSHWLAEVETLPLEGQYTAQNTILNRADVDTMHHVHDMPRPIKRN